ncbi:MAG: LLM class F420-dependent oxidoreductase, partial [Gemmatimonadales bacterium]
YEHVLGANTASRPGWKGPYSHRDMFHEPFTLFAYLAGVTKRLELATGILVLPQRQTALVAKQAAEVDILSGGRLRLGVGIGWNDVEYAALGADFHRRGALISEQIRVLRALWTQDAVTFHGRWHRIDDAGINPLPVQRPIPLWMGGAAEPVLRRIGRLADGWFLSGRVPIADRASQIERVKGYARAAGRDPNAIGFEARIPAAGDPDGWRRSAEEWRRAGGTHLSVGTWGANLAAPDDHLKMVARVRDALREKT